MKKILIISFVYIILVSVLVSGLELGEYPNPFITDSKDGEVCMCVCDDRNNPECCSCSPQKMETLSKESDGLIIEPSKEENETQKQEINRLNDELKEYRIELKKLKEDIEKLQTELKECKEGKPKEEVTEFTEPKEQTTGLVTQTSQSKDITEPEIQEPEETPVTTEPLKEQKKVFFRRIINRILNLFR